MLAAVDVESVDELWCLGDLVGYGPRPNECVALVRERAAVCLAGNHDLAVLGTLDVDRFAGEAGEAVRWTRTILAPEAHAFLEALDTTATRHGVALAHGSPREPVWEYVLSTPSAAAAFAATPEQLILVGHSHAQLAFSSDGTRVAGGQARGGDELELGSARLLLNPGSVGQPRDGDPRAAWLVIDTGPGRATFRRTEYPIERTQAELRERELPELLAARLALGL